MKVKNNNILFLKKKKNYKPPKFLKFDHALIY